MNDLRFGIRLLSRSRAPSLTIVVLLALGIGAGTVIFSLFDAIVLRPLPVRHPEQLARMVVWRPRAGATSQFTYRIYEMLRDRATTMTAIFGEAGDYLHFTLTEPAPAQQIVVYAVTPEYFDALGVEARYGRVLTAQDGRETSGLPPAVLSYGFWSRRFAADPRAIGRTFAVDGHRFTIVGVLPREFNGLAADTAPDVRIPLWAFPLLGHPRDRLTMQLAGRMKPGVTLARAGSEVLALWIAMVDAETDKDAAAWDRRYPISLDPLARGFSTLRSRFGDVLGWVMASAILLALLACANVAGLLAARAAARSHEIAVRLAVGATRMRLLRQILAENLLLTALGVAGGLALAFAVTPILTRSLPPIRQLDSSLLPLVVDARINSRVLLFSLALALLTMLLFTVAPVMAGWRSGIETILRGARSSGGSRGRHVLITVQIALCTFLLCGAGLQVRTFRRLHDQKPGFDTAHVATFTLDLTMHKSPASDDFARLLGERVARLPGVTSVAFSERGVLRDRGVATTVAPEGRATTQADFLNVDIHGVSAGYFETMGIPILEGRSLTPQDGPGAKPVRVVVNEAFARRFFPNQDPVGRRFGRGVDTVVGADFEIVGLCGDAKYRSMREPWKPVFYAPIQSHDAFVLNVRTSAPPSVLLEPVRKVLTSLDPSLAFLEVHTLAEEVDASTAGERLAAAIAASFAGLAALLAGVGIYGLLANAVTQRRREIGIRMAVGADAMDVAGLLWRQTMAIAVTGIVLGVAGMFWVGPLIRSVLYEVSPHDPPSLAAAAALVGVIAIVSAAVPAWRAVRIDPANVLHE
ncbi:MAG TPA: ADOP family duplicated permease [Verrucomicrobiae bacterium]|nr:ADOP family duplicated permease [Verrucomicrobiae bacterium]